MILPSNVQEVLEFLVEETEFKRIKALQEYTCPWSNYDEFVKWNTECVNNLTNGDIAHILWICKLITTSNLSLMDMESCIKFEASGIYFDEDKSLVIVNPR